MIERGCALMLGFVLLFYLISFAGAQEPLEAAAAMPVPSESFPADDSNVHYVGSSPLPGTYGIYEGMQGVIAAIIIATFLYFMLKNTF